MISWLPSILSLWFFFAVFSRYYALALDIDDIDKYEEIDDINTYEGVSSLGFLEKHSTGYSEMISTTALQLATAASLSTASGSSSNVGKEDILDVVIVGSGWSGISAANTLRSNNITNFRVLEARDYVGGRSQSHEIEGMVVNSGTNWLMEYECNPLLDLFEEFGADMTDYTKKFQLYNITGEALSDGYFKYYYKNIISRSWQSRVESEWYVVDEDEPLRKTGSMLKRRFQKYSDSEFRIRFLNAMLEANFDNDYGASLDDLSLWYYNSGEWLCGYDSPWKLVNSKIADVAEFYATPVKEHIETESVVTHIDYNDDIVEITYNASSGIEKVVRSKKVIVTVSLGVLQNNAIGFYPMLPESHQKSIDKLQMGKQVYFFMFWDGPDVFWPSEPDAFYDILSAENNENIAYYQGKREPTPYLIVQMASKKVIDLEMRLFVSNNKKYLNKLKKLAMEPLRRMFGSSIKSPKVIFAHNWNSDPFSYGTYSSYKVGSKPKDRRNLRKPIDNKIFISGEATSVNFYATMHGAYYAGVETGIEVLQSLAS